jgi:hypothetical protein
MSKASNENMGRPVLNKYGVCDAQWKLWTNRQRSMFNRMWHEMRPSRQYSFLPLNAKAYSRDDWDTVRYYMSSCAADLMPK